MMRKEILGFTALALAATLPAVSKAEKLFLDYQGTISEVSPADLDYTVGEHFEGRLTIDTLLAEPGRGGYVGLLPVPHPAGDPDLRADFITGFVVDRPVEDPLHADVTDSVGIANYPHGSEQPDYFSADDDTYNHKGIGLSVTVVKRDLLETTDLVQSFDVRSAALAAGEVLEAFITVDGAAVDWARAALSHVSLRPAQCVHHT